MQTDASTPPLSDPVLEAIKQADKIMVKDQDALAPILREMEIMKWPTEYKVIMLEVIQMEAARQLEALKGKQDE